MTTALMPSGGNAKEDRHFVTALARGLEVLACFRSGGRMLGNQEIARRCKLPKSTVSRLTYTLTKLGYLVQDQADGRYRLGIATMSLGVGMLARLDVRELARPLMQELADFAQAYVALGVRDRLSMLYIENCRSQATLTPSMEVGTRIPIVTSSMGRAYLALAGESERQEIIERLSELDAWSEAQIRAGIQQSITDYRTLGCTCSFGDWQKNVNAVAAGFRPGPGQPIMVMTCGAPARAASREFLLAEVRPRLLDTLDRIQGMLEH